MDKQLADAACEIEHVDRMLLFFHKLLFLFLLLLFLLLLLLLLLVDARPSTISILSLFARLPSIQPAWHCEVLTEPSWAERQREADAEISPSLRLYPSDSL